ncbi:MAG: response regulator [Nocardioidaceae bacterium]
MAVPRILVVDDTDSIRTLIRLNLELEGYDVAEAVDGQDCLDRVAALAPDLITIDVVMPKRDGFSTVRALKADPVTARIPVVMVTTQAHAADRRRGSELGVTAYIGKPFDPDELVAVVRQALGSVPEPNRS